MARLVFIHVPRTAGVSLGTALRDRYGDLVLWVRKAHGLEPARWDVPKGATCIFGHMNYGAHEVFDARYATILREPVGRVRSHYSLKCWRRAGRGEPPMPFLRFMQKPDARNIQCRILAGRWRKPGWRPAFWLFLVAAWRLRRFEHIGLYEELGATAEALGLGKLPRFDSHGAPMKFDGWRPALALALNLGDLGLYWWAKVLVTSRSWRARSRSISNCWPGTSGTA